ncbi:MAG: ComF family protein [Gomphosphaeria aponina SAG 52.96 = DSM 107014]|uniref:ComF family protein n=1 Tax=Gomphosphaeria aponina SAG 52.96 = DSM 107014 TaxID=1521640 RepID=A0A941GQS8_9CHRO|nr:ComF family protein [Gomphosphaeria aponina SAG 52.96 = DSM 107014]
MFKNILSLFLKENCPLCQRPADEIVCKYCQKQLESCKLSNNSQYWQGELPLFVWGEYEGKLKRAIARCKYDNHPELGELLGYWLGKEWQSAPVSRKLKQFTVVPIPLHQKKLKERGFNQAEIIASSFCQITGAKLQAAGLVRVKATKAMYGLKPKEREENLKNALALGKDLQKKTPNSVLIIDDIYTTGTTAKNAAQVLREKGIKVVGIAAIAKPIVI